MTQNGSSGFKGALQTLIFGAALAVMGIFGRRRREQAGEDEESRARARLAPGTRRPALWMFLIALVIAIVAGAKVRSMNPGPEQPIPFSHRFHVGTKNLNCFFCHPTATTSSNAGIPPVEKCLLCHDVIANKFRPIYKITQYMQKGQGIPWERVNQVPDFVHFSHQPHLAKGFDCSRCHGNVREMDRISQAHVFTMGFCVDCHKQNGASVSCFTCHY